LKLNLAAIFRIILYIGIFSSTLPLVFFLLFKRNSQQKTLRVVLFYVLYCVFNDGLSFYLQTIGSRIIFYLLYAFTIVEYSFICYFIYLVLPKNLIKKIVLIAWFSFLLIAFADYISFNPKREFDSFVIGIESIIILLLCIYYLFSQIKGSNSLLIYSTFNFWVVIAFFIYFSGTFFLYLFTDKMGSSLAFQKIYFIINISFNILKNILLCVAMTMKINDTVNLQKTIIPNLDDDLFIKTK